jgi:DNA-binding NtrC family response regulator
MNSDEAQQTILVVEDEVFIRMSAVASLEDAGFAVHDAKDSAEALRVLAQHDDISVMLTDVRMPGMMDGLELVAAVQRDYPAIRAIVASGNSTAAQASKAGAVGFIPKPYMAQTMVQAVLDTLLRYQLPGTAIELMR